MKLNLIATLLLTCIATTSHAFFIKASPFKLHIGQSSGHRFVPPISQLPSSPQSEKMKEGRLSPLDRLRMLAADNSGQSKVATSVRQTIANLKYPHVTQLLADIEREHNVRVLYAVESGSREWSLDSPDSDTNIRFVFVRRHSHSPPYATSLGFNTTTTTTTTTTEEEENLIRGTSDDKHYDWSGMDVDVALARLGRLEPDAVELFYSNKVYKEDDSFPLGAHVRRVLDERFERVFPRLLSAYRMAAFDTFTAFVLNKQRVSLKHYMLVVKHMAMFEWLLLKHGMNATMSSSPSPSPHIDTNFGNVMRDLVASDSALLVSTREQREEVRAAIVDLVAKKRTLSRHDTVERVKCIDSWVQRAVNESFPLIYKLKKPKHEYADLMRDLEAIYTSLLRTLVDF